MAIPWGIFSCVLRRYPFKWSAEYLPWYLGGLFVLVEYGRSWLFSILTWGPNTITGPHWTLGNPVYFLSGNNYLLSTASVWGIYGLDFLMIALVTIIVLMAKSKKGGWIKFGAQALGIVIIVVIGNSISSHTGIKSKGEIKIAVIQTKDEIKTIYSPEETVASFSRKNNLVREAAKEADIIILPERAWFSQTLSQFIDPLAAKKYFNNLSPKNILVVDNNRVSEAGELVSRTTFIDSKLGVMGSYDKQLLTPGGEFVPYVVRWLSLFLRNDSLHGLTEFSAGQESNILNYQDTNIKVLACSDIISPSLSKSGDFNLIIDTMSLGIFKNDPVVSGQMISAAKFRAAESQKALILATNYGHSYLINSSGIIEKSTTSEEYQILTGSVVLKDGRTWYNKLGDWPILLISLALFSMGQFFAPWRKKIYS